MSIETRETPISSQAAEVPAPRKPARRTHSVLSRTAFWTSLVMVILGLGGLITIKIGSGILSQEILITSLGWLVGTIILATKTRWAPMVVGPLYVYIFYLVWTQPYVVESLNNPKGPNGGFGHFFGDILVIAGALIAVACSLGAAVQNLQGKGPQAPRWYPSYMSLVAGLAIGAIFIGAASPMPVTSAGLPLTNGVPTLHVSASGFLQTSITLPKGDKLLLVGDTNEEHDLFNGTWQSGSPDIAQESGAPLVNDIKLVGDSVTIGPFNTAGTYNILCTLHQGMVLTIVVQ